MSQDINQVSQQRRRFIGAAAGAAAGAVAGAASAAGVVVAALSSSVAGNAEAAPRTEPVSDRHRWGMLIDTAKCADGCTACVDACDRENGLNLQSEPLGNDEEKWQNQRPVWIRKVKLQDNATGVVTNLPLMCQHCEHPPCVDVCPTGASFKRADGIVMVDRHTCIGCRYCIMACPYKARSFVHEPVEHKLTRAPRGMGCVESCNLCMHRLDEGQTTTACSDACAAGGHHAILFGDLKDPDSPLRQAMAAQPSRQIREELELNTGVRYAGL